MTESISDLDAENLWEEELSEERREILSRKGNFFNFSKNDYSDNSFFSKDDKSINKVSFFDMIKIRWVFLIVSIHFFLTTIKTFISFYFILFKDSCPACTLHWWRTFNRSNTRINRK